MDYEDEPYVVGGIELPDKYRNKDFEEFSKSYVNDNDWELLDDFSKRLATLVMLNHKKLKNCNLFKSLDEIKYLDEEDKKHYLIDINYALGIIPLKNPHMDNPL